MVRGMGKGWLKFITLVVPALLLVPVLYQNCTLSPNLGFSGGAEKRPGLTAAEGGGGDIFDGKPDPGDFLRTFPNYTCADGTSPESLEAKITVSPSGANLVLDNCASLDLPVNFGDPLVQYEEFNPDYFIYNHAIFARAADSASPIQETDETFCRAVDATSGIDVAVRTHILTGEIKSTVFLGQRPPAGQWTASRTVPFTLTRIQSGTRIQYRSGEYMFELAVESGGPVTSFGYPGRLAVNVDGVTYSRDVTCYRQNREPALIASRIGLVGLWNFDGPAGSGVPTAKGAILDSSPAQNHGTATTSTLTYLPGIFGTGIHFGGNSAFPIRVPPSPSLSNTRGLTISMWVRPIGPHPPGGRVLVEKSFYSQTVPSSGWSFMIQTAGQLYLWVGYSGSNLETGTSNIVPTDTWSHVTMTWTDNGSSGEFAYYIDGVEVTRQTKSGGGFRGDDSTVDMRFGGNTTTPFNADLDEPVIYNRALAPLEVQAIFAHGSAAIR
jgi:hypothetical protein